MIGQYKLSVKIVFLLHAYCDLAALILSKLTYSEKMVINVFNHGEPRLACDQVTTSKEPGLSHHRVRRG